MSKKILLHACCAPCLLFPFRSLVESGYEPVVYFYNPNIMPYREFRKRLSSVKEYCGSHVIPMILDEQYSLERMLRLYLDRGNSPRCLVCYKERLHKTAALAVEKGFDAFTTTLSVSPYQNHNLIREAGENASRAFNVPFLYQDWTSGFKIAHEEAKRENLYLQSYCGCIFSEEERYRPSVRKRMNK
ncbi:epoxyqueuosine reductase QueH [Candidatus Sumerlaeota bacterium]|nr:epoxyqueuosine reductase QueH [Candidatus Sumerlaeota bacterium]